MATTSDNLSPHHKSLLNKDRRATGRALFHAMEPYRKLHPNMTLQIFMSFLRVVMDEGKSVTEYANDAEMFKTVMTRHLLDLGVKDRYGEEGLGLIEQVRDTKDQRIMRAYVTAKGVATIDTARHLLGLLFEDGARK